MQFTLLLGEDNELIFLYVASATSVPVAPFVFASDPMKIAPIHHHTVAELDSIISETIMGAIQTYSTVRQYNQAHPSNPLKFELSVVPLGDENREYKVSFTGISYEELSQLFPAVERIAGSVTPPANNEEGYSPDRTPPGGTPAERSPVASPSPSPDHSPRSEEDLFSASLAPIDPVPRNREIESHIQWFEETFKIKLKRTDDKLHYLRLPPKNNKIAFEGEGIKDLEFAEKYIMGSLAGYPSPPAEASESSNPPPAPAPESSVVNELVIPLQFKEVTPHWSRYLPELRHAIGDFRDTVLDEIRKIDDIRRLLRRPCPNPAINSVRQRNLQRRLLAKEEKLIATLHAYKCVFTYFADCNTGIDNIMERYQKKFGAIEQCRIELLALGWREQAIVGFCVLLGILIGLVGGYFAGATIGAFFGAAGGTAFLPLVGTIHGAIAGGTVGGIWGAIKGGAIGGAIGATVGAVVLGFLNYRVSSAVVTRINPMRRAQLRFFNACEAVLEHGQQLDRLIDGKENVKVSTVVPASPSN